MNDAASHFGGATRLTDPDPDWRLLSIEARRLGIGLSRETLCVRAGITTSFYRKALAGGSGISTLVLMHLTEALAGKVFERPPPPAPPPRPLLRAAYDSFHARACGMVGLTVDEAQAIDSSRGGAAGVKAGLARRIAIYALRTKFELAGPVIADVVGVSKVTVHMAIQAVEDQRERHEFADELDRMIASATDDREAAVA
jgi:hypothetical protein